MRTSILLAGVLSALPLIAQTSADAKAAPTDPSAVVTPGSQDYVCPMDPDVRSDKPGKCPRCGMSLVLGIPDQVEYPLDVKFTPSHFHAGDKVEIAFSVKDPKNAKTVNRFEIVHEKLFHMFIVSSDLKYFLHDHPVFGEDGVFRYEEKFPKAGMYRVLGDFYPSGGIPQLVSRTIFVPGAVDDPVSLSDPKLAPDMEPQNGGNTEVELVTDPPQPISGMKTLMFFKLKTADKLHKYLGAWAHMLAASDDLMDMIHEHPFIADGGPQMQFNLIFPRAHTYRVWIQFDRDGVVNTVAFNVPVTELK